METINVMGARDNSNPIMGGIQSMLTRLAANYQNNQNNAEARKIAATVKPPDIAAPPTATSIANIDQYVKPTKTDYGSPLIEEYPAGEPTDVMQLPVARNITDMVGQAPPAQIPVARNIADLVGSMPSAPAVAAGHPSARPGAAPTMGRPTATPAASRPTSSRPLPATPPKPVYQGLPPQVAPVPNGFGYDLESVLRSKYPSFYGGGTFVPGGGSYGGGGATSGW